MKKSSEISLGEMVSSFEYAKENFDSPEDMWDFLLEITDGETWMRFFDIAKRYRK
jgi:hypothetical protein